ncbi:unnamed protein product [Calypogeia fissa]
MNRLTEENTTSRRKDENIQGVDLRTTATNQLTEENTTSKRKDENIQGVDAGRTNEAGRDVPQSATVPSQSSTDIVPSLSGFKTPQQGPHMVVSAAPASTTEHTRDR